MIIDTHSHLYMHDYNEDLPLVISRAKAIGVQHVVLPGVDSESIEQLFALAETDPAFFSVAVGLHPTSVKEDYKEELAHVKKMLDMCKVCAIGETGLDLYWDKTFFPQQVIAFEQQIQWSLEYNLPLILHIREAFDEAFDILQKYKSDKLRGICHSFGGSVEEAQKIISLENFRFGINGVVTFKNSGLANTLKEVPLDFVVLETDAPWLSPTPHRGKRNEPAYLQMIIAKLAEVYNLSSQEIEDRTTQNAISILNLNIA